jgi:hypothetical protein
VTSLLVPNTHDICVNETPKFVMLCRLEHAASLRHKPRPQDIQLANKQRSRTVRIVTIAFASAIALSAIAPAFAYENDLENGAPASTMKPMDHLRAGMHANAHRPFDAHAYVPAPAPVVAPYDFGIANQGN